MADDNDANMPARVEIEPTDEHEPVLFFDGAEEVGMDGGWADAAIDCNIENNIASPDMLKKEVSTMCVLCGEQPRRTKQCFGGCCEALVRAARRDAKAQGKEQVAAFGRMQKLGHEAFVTVMMTYKAKCFNVKGHRRPNYDWVRSVMIFELSTHVEVGTKCVWLTESAFCTVLREQDGLSEVQGKQRWIIEMQQALPDKKSRCGKKLLWPIEEFVLSYDSKAQKEQLQVGTKDFEVFNNCLIILVVS